MFVGIVCSLMAMAADVTFGLTQAIDTEKKTLGAVSYTGTTNVTNSGVKRGSEVNAYAATGSGKTVYINNTAYVTESHWRKSANTSAYSANQWAGYELTVATGYKLNITGVRAMLSVADDTYTWKVSILDASDQVLYESQNKTTKKATTTDFKLDYASLPEATKAKLTGVTGTIKVRVYMYQGGSTKYFAIPYLTVTGNVEESTTPSYEVTATADPVAGGTVSGDGSWEQGKNVSLTATPNKGYKFVKWTIDEETTSTDNPYVISSIAAAHSAVATFEALPKITYTLGEGAGKVPAVDYAEAGAKVTLPSAQTQLIYKEGYTMTGWTDGENTYAVGAQAPVTGDMTFTAVFEENQAAIGDAETTVDWNFKTSTGAPAGAFEGNIGYYAKKATINGKSVDVIMKINTETGAAFPEARGKWNTEADANRAQVNKGTIFTIPAVSGMVVTMTITNGTAAADMFTFNGEQGEADAEAKTVSYTYNGAAATIDIIDQGKNTYPAGLKVVYPVVQTGEDSDLDVEKALIDISASQAAPIRFSTSSTGEVKVKSSNEEVASAYINEDRIIIFGEGAGTATITLSQAADDTYKAGEKTITVNVTDPRTPTVVYNWNTVGTTTLAGTAVAGEVNIKNVNTAGIKFGNGLSTTNYLKIEAAEGGFKAGDVVTFTGVINNKDNTKQGAIMIVSDAADGDVQLACSELFNNTADATVSATTGSFTLTEDAECLYIGRATSGISNATTTWLTELTVSRTAVIAETTLNAKGFATFSAPYGVKIEGAKVYVAKLDLENNKIIAKEVEDGEVPGGAGVLLAGKPNAKVTASYMETGIFFPFADNDLLATTVAGGSIATKVPSLVLSGDTFVKFSGDAFTANKAYFPYEVAAAGKPLAIVFEDSEATQNDAAVVEEQKELKGKFIQNGKLVIINGAKKTSVAGYEMK